MDDAAPGLSRGRQPVADLELLRNAATDRNLDFLLRSDGLHVIDEKRLRPDTPQGLPGYEQPPSP